MAAVGCWSEGEREGGRGVLEERREEVGWSK